VWIANAGNGANAARGYTPIKKTSGKAACLDFAACMVLPPVWRLASARFIQENRATSATVQRE
jgi:hypothetical protein